VIIEMRISAMDLMVFGSATREGPEALRVAARERLISVTVALYTTHQYVASVSK